MAYYGSCWRAWCYFIKYAYVNDVIAQIGNAIYMSSINVAQASLITRFEIAGMSAVAAIRAGHSGMTNPIPHQDF